MNFFENIARLMRLVIVYRPIVRYTRYRPLYHLQIPPTQELLKIIWDHGEMACIFLSENESSVWL